MAGSEGPQADKQGLERGHPLAVWAFRQLQDRGEADKRLVFEALQTRLVGAESNERQQIAIHALRGFAAARAEVRNAELQASERGTTGAGATWAGATGEGATGEGPTTARAPDQQLRSPKWALGAPSRRRYELFRDAQPDRRAWPSSQLIWNGFGGWTAALAAAGMAAKPDVLSRRLVARGRAYTRDEVELVLKQWKADLDADDDTQPLTIVAYERWAGGMATDPDSSPKRVPAYPTIRKLIGQWPDVLNMLGCPERGARVTAIVSQPSDLVEVRREAPDCDAAKEERLAEQAATIDLATAPARVWGHAADKADLGANELIAWLKWLGSHLSRGEAAAMTMSAYQTFRRLLTQRAWKERPDEVFVIPAPMTIARHPEIGSWPAAKVMAGLLEPSSAYRQSSTKHYDDEELLEAVVAGAESLRQWPLNRKQWEDYRSSQLRELARSDLRARLPSEGVLRARFGGPTGRWSKAIAAIETQRPMLSELREQTKARVGERGDKDGRAA